MKDVLVMRYDKYINMDYLGLAIESKCKNFVASNIIQSILEDIWKGVDINLNPQVNYLKKNFISMFKFNFTLSRILLKTHYVKLK